MKDAFGGCFTIFSDTNRATNIKLFLLVKDILETEKTFKTTTLSFIEGHEVTLCLRSLFSATAPVWFQRSIELQA